MPNDHISRAEINMSIAEAVDLLYELYKITESEFETNDKKREQAIKLMSQTLDKLKYIALQL